MIPRDFRLRLLALMRPGRVERDLKDELASTSRCRRGSMSPPVSRNPRRTAGAVGALAPSLTVTARIDLRAD